GSGGMMSTGPAGGAGGGFGAGGMPNETPGTIACGPVQCNLATEVCCPDGAMSTCSPMAMGCPGASLELPYGPLGCDDAADCGAGKVCCVEQVGTQLGYGCSAAPCMKHEVCIPGGVCTDGFECVPDASEPSGARCVATDASVHCGTVDCTAPDAVCCLGMM